MNDTAAKSAAETFTIEDGIPVPPHGNRKDTGLASVLRQMTAGQSVLIKDRARNSVAVQVSKASRAAGDKRRYAVRAVDGGVRVWRII